MLFTAVQVCSDPSTYAGVGGATVLDSGVMVVSGGPRFARNESFEYLRRPRGGITLINTITAADGAFRVRARFDLDERWRSLGADGVGLYDGTPVRSSMRIHDDSVDIAVDGEGIALRPSAECDPDCFLNMSPSSLAMFVMTRHYDKGAGGEQRFRWAGQDLDRARTLSGGTADLSYAGRIDVPRSGQRALSIDHYTFVETLPAPGGGTFSLNFDLWTDVEHRPMGFRVRTAGSGPGATVGFRQGFADVRAALLDR